MMHPGVTQFEDARLPMRDLPLARMLVTRHSRLPRQLRTVGDALAMIENDIPRDVVERPHWIAARDRLHAARESESARDIEDATIEVENALKREGWLH